MCDHDETWVHTPERNAVEAGVFTKPQEIQGDYSLTLVNINSHCLYLNNNDVTA